MPQPMKIPDAGAAADNLPAWKLDKVKSKEDVILEAQKEKKKVHFATLMVICHIGQNVRTRNFRARNEIVERGAVTKSQTGRKALR